MRRMQVLPFKEEDRKQLEEWRLSFVDATLELSHDYVSEQVETAVVRDESGQIIIALTGTIASGLGPLIKNPAASKLEIMQALIMAEAALNYKAVQAGAVDAFVVIPKRMQGYIKTLEKLGYKLVADECVIMGRILKPDLPKIQIPEENLPEVEPTEDEQTSVAEAS